MPPRGGWSVTYKTEELSRDFSARASTPGGVLSLIVQHRLANDLPADMDGVKYFLEEEWFSRDKARFTRQPRRPSPKAENSEEDREPDCGLDSLYSAVLGMVNAAATVGSKQAVISVMQALQEVLKRGRFKCDRCDLFIAEFMKQYRLENLKTPSLVRDWAWEFQRQLAQHLNRPLKPRAAVEAQWCWPPSS